MVTTLCIVYHHKHLLIYGELETSYKISKSIKITEYLEFLMNKGLSVTPEYLADVIREHNSLHSHLYLNYVVLQPIPNIKSKRFEI